MKKLAILALSSLLIKNGVNACIKNEKVHCSSQKDYICESVSHVDHEICHDHDHHEDQHHHSHHK